MMLACWRAQVLLERRGAGLEDSDRLRLEQHLERCSECAAQANALSRAVQLLEPSVELTAMQRSRVLTRALARRRASSRAPVERSLVAWFLAPIAVSALVIAVLALTARPRVTALAAFPAPALVDAPRHFDRLSSGDLYSGAERLAPGQTLASGVELRTTTGAALALAHARVELAAESRATWDAEHRLLTLAAGRVHVEVDPRPAKSFGVGTSRFQVEVKGTVFDVSLDDVSVREGRVRVVAGELVTELGPGQRWSADATSAGEGEIKSAVNVASLLAHARRRLAARDVEAARRDVNAVLRARPSATEDAEARSLLAECALVGGDTAEAQRRYAEVAAEHAGTPAAETAEFAAARLEADPARGKKLLVGYLAKYPKGRFRNEAENRLRALEH